jgi:pectinesterase inhibitor-like protein
MAIKQHHMPLLLLLVVFLLPAPGSPALATTPLINSTCTAAANSTWFTPYAYCVRTLSAIPAAAAATDARGLGAAAANLTARNVTTTIHVLTDLVGALNHCITMYRIMNGSVAGALNDLRVGRTDVAWPKLKDAAYRPNFCDMALAQSKTNKDPLFEENYTNQMLAGMANDIIELIAKKKAR